MNCVRISSFQRRCFVLLFSIWFGSNIVWFMMF